MKISKNKTHTAKQFMATSLSAAAECVGIKPAFLAWAKKKGVTAFRANGSVCISELEPWLIKNLPEPMGLGVALGKLQREHPGIDYLEIPELADDFDPDTDDASAFIVLKNGSRRPLIFIP